MYIIFIICLLTLKELYVSVSRQNRKCKHVLPRKLATDLKMDLVICLIQDTQLRNTA